MRLALILSVFALLFCGPVVAGDGKTLRMAYDADPASLDPHEQLSGATLQLSHLVFDPLGCGEGERVMVATGSVAAAWFPGKAPPIDALVIGTIDEPSKPAGKSQ